jgi:hypothetical protein
MRKPIIRSNVNPLALPTLFFAGRAALTFRNTEKETHMTIKVKQARDKFDRKKKLPIFFLSVSLLGDRNTGYIHAATIYQDTMNIKLSSSAQNNEQLLKVVQFIWNALANPQILKDKKVALLHEGRCCRCSMPLTHPESINTGFGPDCLEHILAGGIKVDQLFFTPEA